MSQTWKIERATLKDLSDIELVMKALILIVPSAEMRMELERRTCPYQRPTFYCQKCGKVPGGFENQPETKCECPDDEAIPPYEKNGILVGHTGIPTTSEDVAKAL